MTVNVKIAIESDSHSVAVDTLRRDDVFITGGLLFTSGGFSVFTFPLGTYLRYSVLVTKYPVLPEYVLFYDSTPSSTPLNNLLQLHSASDVKASTIQQMRKMLHIFLIPIVRRNMKQTARLLPLKGPQNDVVLEVKCLDALLEKDV